ncbi:MAG: hypothetical protein LBQ35_05720 [Spirochaetaceae bacterium]|jgi:hypothetical protein|nr:hypothetical protein [Spirochaetaceae bacterium]
MEAVVKIMDARALPSFFDIPDEMRNDKVQVIIMPVPKENTMEPATPKINMGILEKFRTSAESGEFREHLKKKLAEGFKFEFDAQKIIDGTETEEEKQQRYRMEKRAWPDSVAERIKKGEL